MLRAQLDHLDKLDAEGTTSAETGAAAEPAAARTHASMYTLFAAEAISLNAQARKAAFVGAGVPEG